MTAVDVLMGARRRERAKGNGTISAELLSRGCSPFTNGPWWDYLSAALDIPGKNAEILDVALSMAMSDEAEEAREAGR